MSISQNFPAEGPTLNLNFAGSKKLDPRITFTRTSTATYMDDNGLITIAPTDTPRFEHSVVGVGSTVTGVQSLGLLIEESRTNLITYSEQFNDASWTKGNLGITTNTSATTAPDGSTNAEKLVEDTTASTFHRIEKSLTSLSSGNVTYSVYLKSAGRDYAFLRVYNITNASSYINVKFNLSSGTIDYTDTGTASITNVGNGWYRCVVTANNPSTSNNIAYVYLSNQSGSSEAYTGDGTSGVYAWGAQLEAGAFPTSYIPTVASTVTRSADNTSMTGTNFSSWYNPTASTGGAILVQARRGYSGNFSGYPNLYVISDGTGNNTIKAYGVDASVQFSNYGINTGGVLQTDYVAANISTTNLFKSIHTFATNSSTLCINGTLTTTDTSVTLPTVTRLNIGQSENAGNTWNGTISSLSYYPNLLTNSQLQNLTK